MIFKRTTIILFLIVCSILFTGIESILANPEKKYVNEIRTYSRIWKMAKELGKRYNVKRWVFHDPMADRLPWKQLIHSIMKEKDNLGYFASHTNSSKIASSNLDCQVLKSSLSLHLLFHQNIDHLQHMVSAENSEFPNPNCNEKFNKGLSSKSNIWMILMPDNVTIDGMREHVNEVDFTYDTNSFCFTFNSVNVIQIYDAYKIQADSNVTFKYFGSWNDKRGLSISKSDIWSRRVSLEGLHLRTVSGFNPPATAYITDQCSTNNCFKGMYPDIWNELSKKMNFTYTVSREYEWGAIVNGTWSGMVGRLEKGTADIAVADITLTKDRSAVVQFLPPLEETQESLFLKNPIDAFSTNSYVGSFTYQLWIAIALWMLCIPAILAGMLFYGKDVCDRGIGLVYCCRFVVESMAVFITTAFPTTNSIKGAFVSVALGGMLIHYHWDAELITNLATRKIFIPFRNLDELLEKTSYSLVIGRGTSHLDSFRYAHDSVRRTLWAERIEPRLDDLPLYKDLITTILNDPNSVAYMESNTKISPEYINCQIIDTGTPLKKTQLGWAMPKHSPYYLTFEYHIKKLKEIGIVQRFAKMYEAEHQTCPDYSGKPISMQQCIVAFKILAAGYACGIFFLGLERCLPRRLMIKLQEISSKNGHKTPEGKFTTMRRKKPGDFTSIKKERNCIALKTYQTWKQTLIGEEMKKEKSNQEQIGRKPKRKQDKNDDKPLKHIKTASLQNDHERSISQLIEQIMALRKDNANLIIENHFLKSKNLP